MKTAILLFSFAGIVAASATEPVKQDDSYTWPMFRRADVVTLEGRDIPAEYKRNKITDAKGRVIEGEWLVIDRKAQVVKFHRKADGQQFDIRFADLCETDRRYAELETGELWAPLWPVVFAPEERRKTINYATRYLTANAEWVRIDREARIIHAFENGEERRFNIDDLNPDDLAFAMDPDTPSVLPPDKRRKTISFFPQKQNPQEGEWLEVDPFKRWVKFRNSQGRDSMIGFDQLDKADREFAENKDGKSWPKQKFDPAGVNPQVTHIPQFRTAWANMSKAYTQEEIFDHLRVRTLTSAYLYEYSAYCIKRDYDRQLVVYQKIRESEKPDATNPTQKPINTIASLEDIMRMLTQIEPIKEKVSIKPEIEKSGIQIFEEPTPYEDNSKPKYGAPNGPPLDGHLQGMHFIAQFMQLTAKKEKVPFANLFESVNKRQISHMGEAPGYLSFDQNQVENAIGKAFGLRAWRIPQYVPNAVISQKLARQLIRNKQPVFVTRDDLKGYAVLIGFTLEPGKEPTYEAIMVDGPVGLPAPPITNLPYKTRFEDAVPQSKFVPNLITTYLEPTKP